MLSSGLRCILVRVRTYVVNGLFYHVKSPMARPLLMVIVRFTIFAQIVCCLHSDLRALYFSTPKRERIFAYACVRTLSRGYFPRHGLHPFSGYFKICRIALDTDELPARVVACYACRTAAHAIV